MSRQQKTVRIYSGFADGVIGIKSEIEISQTAGLPSFDIIGLCDSSIRESRGRIKAALIASGYDLPRGRITVNITPAYMHKSGSGFDLAIALGLLLVSGQIILHSDNAIYAEGELSLDGLVKATPGSAVRLKQLVHEPKLITIIPQGEINSAKINSICGFTVNSLSEATQVLANASSVSTHFVLDSDLLSQNVNDNDIDISLLKGQEKTIRALQISASGWHNLLLVGSPGAGKTLAGKILHSLLPPLYPSEINEVYSIYDIWASDGLKLTSDRPFRYIQQNITPNRLICSGTNMKPGEIILANKGILFADELCEFNSGVLDLLREPMENRSIHMTKDGKAYNLQSDFLFIGATNPCKCGMYMEPGKKCICTPSARNRYLNRLSGPFIDRIDLFSELHMIDEQALRASISSKSLNLSQIYREQVSNVWNLCNERYKTYQHKFNGTVEETNLAELFRADSDVIELATKLTSINGYSARGMNKLLRVSRTIADIENSKDIKIQHIQEAQLYKNRIFNQGGKI